MPASSKKVGQPASSPRQDGAQWRRSAQHIPLFNPKLHRWTPADDKLLSERPNAQVAMLLGISQQAVRQRRSRLSIMRPGRQYVRLRPWQPWEEALLGTVSNSEVARQLGRGISSVRQRRIELGLQTPCHHWTPEADALLGKLADKDVARRLGRTARAVATRRARLGIFVSQVGGVKGVINSTMRPGKDGSLKRVRQRPSKVPGNPRGRKGAFGHGINEPAVVY